MQGKDGLLRVSLCFPSQVNHVILSDPFTNDLYTVSYEQMHPSDLFSRISVVRQANDKIVVYSL